MIFATCFQIMPEHAAKKLKLVEITTQKKTTKDEKGDFEL